MPRAHLQLAGWVQLQKVAEELQQEDGAVEVQRGKSSVLQHLPLNQRQHHLWFLLDLLTLAAVAACCCWLQLLLILPVVVGAAAELYEQTRQLPVAPHMTLPPLHHRQAHACFRCHQNQRWVPHHHCAAHQNPAVVQRGFATIDPACHFALQRRADC
jgi:hypothetical protein